MTPEAYANRGTLPGNTTVQKPNAAHKRFALALSAAVARRMKQDPNLDCLYALYKRIPEVAGVPPMTVYSALYVSTRPSVWVMHYVAGALNTTLSALIEEARELMISGVHLETAGEAFKGKKKSGRPAGPPRDESQRWAKRTAKKKGK